VDRFGVETDGIVEEGLYDLARNKTNPTTTVHTQGSAPCNPSPLMNTVLSVASFKLVAPADTGAVPADSGSTSIPTPIMAYTTKIAEIAKALDTLSSIHADHASSRESSAAVPKSISDFSAKTDELKQTLETLNPVLDHLNVKSASPDSDAPSLSPSPVTRLQSSLDRIASTTKTRGKTSADHEDLEAPSAESIIPHDPSDTLEHGSVEDPVSSVVPSDRGTQGKYIYKILAYDSGNDVLTTTTTTTPPRPGYQDAILGLPDALSMLSNPSKFVPHLPTNVEPVLAFANLLVLRETPDIKDTEERDGHDLSETETPPIGTIDGRPNMNPVDGTTVSLPEASVGNFASPTGFVSYIPLSAGSDYSLDPAPSAKATEQDLAVEHDEDKYVKQSGQDTGRGWRGSRHRHSESRSRGSEGQRTRGGAVSVARTAILGVSACYIAGVVGEVIEPRR
jgi:hypothetical protein